VQYFAYSFTTCQALNTIASYELEVLPHPPYSLDIATVTIIFWTNKMLDGQKFASDMEAQSAVRQWLGQQLASVFCRRQSETC